jgi:hypothetical protein
VRVEQSIPYPTADCHKRLLKANRNVRERFWVGESRFVARLGSQILVGNFVVRALDEWMANILAEPAHVRFERPAEQLYVPRPMVADFLCRPADLASEFIERNYHVAPTFRQAGQPLTVA